MLIPAQHFVVLAPPVRNFSWHPFAFPRPHRVAHKHADTQVEKEGVPPARRLSTVD